MNSNPNFQWTEDLPKNCPPEEATSPEGMDLYRLVNSNPPTNEDFLPHPLCRGTACIKKSVSLFTLIDRVIELQKLPRHKEKLIAKVILNQKDGLIKQTFSNPAHYSWWRTSDFDPKKIEII